MRNVESSPSYLDVEVLEKPRHIMPLYENVPPPEKRKNISSDLLNTAGHELNHAIVAIASGTTVLKVSVIPEGNSLGRTEFAGILSPDIIKIIAAAGSVATHDGCAHGHGRDMHRVDLLTHFYGGISKQTAVNIAESLIMRYPTDVRKKAAEIIAYLKEVSGDKIPLVLERAKMEIALEKGILNYEITSEEKADNNLEKLMSINRKTIIEHLRNGDQKVIYVIGNKVEIEELICHLCLNVNGHADSCPRHKKEEKVIFPIFPLIRS